MLRRPDSCGRLMAEIEPAEVPAAPRPVQLRQCTVLVGERYTPDPEFPVGHYEFFETGDGCPDTRRIAIIAVVEIEGRVVVAVPHSVWHRNLSRRQLPVNSLTKPICITVPFEDRRAEGDEEPPLVTEKLWLGYLAPSHEEQVVFDSSGEGPDADVCFVAEEPSFLPTAEGLAVAVEKHFAFTFVSASGGDTPLPSPTPTVDTRLQQLEASLTELTSSLKHLIPAPPIIEATSKATPVPCPPGLEKPKRAEKSNPPPTVAATRGLAPDVLQSARAAGIPEAQLQEMARLAGRGRPAMEDLPAVRPRSSGPRNPLSESEEEAADDDELQGPDDTGSADPLAAVLTKLTNITAHLAKQKKAKSSSWELVMDGASGSGSAENTSSSSRRHAAALRLLKQSLRNNPKSIYETVESNMSDDFQNVRQLPGNAAVQVTSRGWLELRSRVQNFATPVRLLWGIAGVHDALRQGAHDEARARAALLLCQGDQLSVDRGSWVVASELGLEDAPPFASFDQHRLPSEAEPPYSKLIDPRWMELVLHRLNEFDQLSEKKKKLSKKPVVNPGRDDDPINLKGKGGKKGKKGNQQPADDAATSTA